MKRIFGILEDHKRLWKKLGQLNGQGTENSELRALIVAGQRQWELGESLGNFQAQFDVLYAPESEAYRQSEALFSENEEELNHLLLQCSQENSAYLSIVIGEEQIFTALVGPKGLQLITTKASALNLGSVISKAEESLNSTGDEWRIRFTELSELLGLSRLDFTGLDELAISLDGGLHTLPADLFMDASGKPLIDKTPIRLVRSSEEFVAQGIPVVLSGVSVFNPSYPDYEARISSRADSLTWLFRLTPEFVQRCGPLPSDDGLIAQMAQQTSVHLLSAQQATELSYRKALLGSDMIILNGHGFAHVQDPWFSGLVFSEAFDVHADVAGGFEFDQFESDGVLHTFELLDLDVQCPHVVLGACESAVGPDLPGGGSFSLAATYLDQGAQAVIGTLWAIDDQSTSELITIYMQELMATGNCTVALYNAKQKFRESHLTASPHHWAGLQLFGENLSVQFQKP